MKKMTLRLVMLVMAALLACAPALAEVDAFTSASVTDFYGDNALTGDELMNAINSFSGFYLVCTTNPDGAPTQATSSMAARSWTASITSRWAWPRTRAVRIC